MMIENSLYQDTTFRRIVVYSTGLGLALMVASLASIHISPAGVNFQWHWSILLWMAATMIFNARLWKLVWQAQANPTPAIRKKLAAHAVVLAVIGAGSFLYPIRFIAEGYLSGVSRGLVTAIVFLGTLVLLLAKVGRGFVVQDETELHRQKHADGSITS